MNGTKIFGTVLAVVLVVFMIAPIASAQQYPDILNDQWFKVKLSMKGYRISSNKETVLGKESGSKTVYLHFVYHNNSTYTVTTCTQDDLLDSFWYKNTSAAISIDDIYGAVYPQVWDLKSTFLTFEDGTNIFTTFVTFSTKITADGHTLKNATISNEVCTLFADLEDGEYGTGSCTLSGPLVPAAKVEKTVPLDCR